MANSAIQRLLHPRSIAVLGASDNPVKLSGRPIELMKRFGYTGRLLPVNARRAEVQGLPAYRDLDEIDGEIDLAMVMLPADKVADGLRDCAARGIPAAIVGASGFAEIGARGEHLQRQLEAVIAETGIRVLGPNCLGMFSLRDRAMPTFTSAMDDSSALVDGPAAFVSQSGAFGTFIFSAAQHAGLGISHFLNTGNEADLSVAEVLGGLVETDGVEVLMAYLEGVHRGRELLAVARRAHELDKPILVVKVGSSEAGARAARSHTASLAGEDAVFDGAARQHGIVRLAGQEQLLDTAQVFAGGRRARGRRLSTLSLSGGAGVLMADVASDNGLLVQPWDEAWQQQMAEVIPAYGSPRNPIDLTATLISDPDLLRRGLDVAVRHPGTDMIAVLLGNADNASAQLIDAIEQAHRATDRPLVVVWTGGSGRPRRRLQELGIPCFTDPGRAAAALGKLADFSLRPPLPEPERPDDIDEQVVRAIIQDLRDEGRTQLDEHESSRLIAAYGIPCAGAFPAKTPDAAVAAAHELGGPVAVKLLSRSIGHKSDIGGVRLGLTGDAEIRVAAEELLTVARDAGDPGARLLVQRMAAGTELIVGIKRDPAFGPVVVVGFGGVLVDVLADSRVGVAPLDVDAAERLLLSLRGSRLFGEVRGKPARDLGAAADAVARLSWLAHDLADDIAELDVNPLLLDEVGKGVIAVDCLAVLTPAE
ncbi:Acyl-CoA synthetase (NDP forming) [Saccharopolyspora antimicrobica]|uniref:Acyl-CoA synthetase (NDP forming) n=1 Tax=Saccharopolyspora antimicrobica TaxID=455193 RepID=A0A1I5H0B0_9PSEU|nr:acetate--CoA ligase family protein [Saccharopolyspora antimicrobica]RKT90058.1 acyl-CoA synthetase (NDP forming) [Saccharopolyspora antimicrobica]SFO41738.1 Acyl-CoA synthetase (NDP forming) [Saccharopolyspora antimicrobica]